MRVTDIFIEGFKTVDPPIWLAPADGHVFFGPNDSGKSNLLEALGRTFTRYELPARGEHEVTHYGYVVFELDGLDSPGHHDAILLDDLLRYGTHTHEGEPGPPLTYRVGGHRPFRLDLPGTASLAAMKHQLRTHILQAVEADCSCWSRLGPLYAFLLDTALSSRWLRIFAGAIEWLFPPLAEIPERDLDNLRAAAEILLSEEGCWEGATDADPEDPGDARDLESAYDPELDYAEGPCPLLGLAARYIVVTGPDSPYWSEPCAPWFEWLAPGWSCWDIRTLWAHEARNAPAIIGALERQVTVLAWRLEQLASPGADARALTSSPPRRWRPWVQEGKREQPRRSLELVCERLGPLATRFAPRFVRDKYRIEVIPVILPPDEEGHSQDMEIRPVDPPGRRGRARGRRGRLEVQLHVRGPHSGRGSGLRLWSGPGPISPVLLEEAGSGIMAWVGYALEEAIRRFRLKLMQDAGLLRAGFPQEVLFIDEPERLLHPLAQEDVAQWLADRLREGATIFLATHALPFLDLPWQNVEYYRVHRHPQGYSVVTPITEDPLGELSRCAEESGLRLPQLVQLTRGFLVVEGNHDLRVISHFYGSELGRARIRIIRLQGYHEALALGDPDFLLGLGLPVALLLDDVRAEEADAFRRGRWRGNGHSGTEKKLRTLALLLERKDLVSPVPLPLPDIVAALPDGATAEVLRRRGIDFPGWASLVAAFRSSRGRDFKEFVQSRLGLGNLAIGTLIEQVLQECEPTDRPAPALHRAIQQVLADIEEPRYGGGNGHG